jgi:hypothetical protein
MQIKSHRRSHLKSDVPSVRKRSRNSLADQPMRQYRTLARMADGGETKWAGARSGFCRPYDHDHIEGERSGL